MGLRHNNRAYRGESQSARWNFQGLRTLEDSLKEGYSVDVGIFQDHATRTNKGKSNIDNAALGAAHEFGIVHNNTPARSWLRMPVVKGMRQGFNKVIENNKKIYQEALLKRGGTRSLFVGIGHTCLDYINAAFNSSGFGTWKRNTDSTMLKKKRNTPLKDTRQLKDSVSFRVVKDKR